MGATNRVIVVCGESALRAIRCHRRRYARLDWDPLSAAEQRRLLAAGIPNAGHIDWDALAIAGVWSEGEPLHVLAGDEHRTHGYDPLVCHSTRVDLPKGSIMRVGANVYATSPALTSAQLGTCRSYGWLRGLLEELTGAISLSEIDGAALPCEPILSPKELQAQLGRLSKISGVKRARDVAKYVLGSARSPMEAIMYGVFTTPMSKGGLGCLNGEPNQRVALTARAEAVARMPYVICDLLYKNAGKTLEYNGVYHATDDARKHDERRTAGLAAMGIGTIPINNEILANQDALTGIAQVIWRSEGRQFRIRVRDYWQKQRRLLNELRSWCNLPPIR